MGGVRRLAVTEDVNDALRLRHDSAMRWIVGGKAASGAAALSAYWWINKLPGSYIYNTKSAGSPYGSDRSPSSTRISMLEAKSPGPIDLYDRDRTFVHTALG